MWCGKKHELVNSCAKSVVLSAIHEHLKLTYEHFISDTRRGRRWYPFHLEYYPFGFGAPEGKGSVPRANWNVRTGVPHDETLSNQYIDRTWAVALALGPLVGGAFAQHGQWRWLFCELLQLASVLINRD